MRQAVVILAGLVAWGLLGVLTAHGLPGGAGGASGQIQRELQAAADAALTARGYDWARVRVDGQVALLEGRAPRDDERVDARWAVQRAAGEGGFIRGGVILVDDDTSLSPEVRPFEWRAVASNGGVTMTGVVPTRDVRSGLMDFADSLFPGGVENRLEIARGAPEETDWPQVARIALSQLAVLAEGRAMVKDYRVTLDGRASTAALGARASAGLADVPVPYVSVARIDAPDPAPGEIATPDPDDVGEPGGRIESVDDCQSMLDQFVAAERIAFRTGSAEIDRDSYGLLDRLAVVARRCEGMRIMVEGHTDNSGDPGANLELSQRRANAVRDYFVAQGVESDRLRARGMGDALPVGDNSTEEGRALNRRIEFRIDR